MTMTRMRSPLLTTRNFGREFLAKHSETPPVGLAFQAESTLHRYVASHPMSPVHNNGRAFTEER
jgi:hypothetical protein